MLTRFSRKLIQNISTKRFFDILKEQHIDIEAGVPEDSLLSRHLKNNNHLKNKQYVKLSQKIEKKGKINSANTPNYQEFLKGNPDGNIIQKQYKNVELNLMSLSYNQVVLSQLYEALERFNPDIILIQTRPDFYLQNFELIPKTAGSFSDVKYLDSLILKEDRIKKLMLTDEIYDKFCEITDKDKQNPSNNKGKEVSVKERNQILQVPIILTSAFYASKNKKDVLLGQCPEQVYRQWICNSHTLMELQEIFKNICKNIPFYQSFRFSLFKLGTLLYPETFLNLNDKYMATLIEMLIANNKNRRILGIFGMMQSEAINEILENEMTLIKNEEGQQYLSPIVEFLVPQGPKGSILKNIEGWEIIEKHIIFDILQYGEQIAIKKFNEFKTTNTIISHYGEDLFHYSPENILRFRYQKTLYYLDLFREKVQEGKEMGEKFMMREALRNQD